MIAGVAQASRADRVRAQHAAAAPRLDAESGVQAAGRDAPTAQHADAQAARHRAEQPEGVHVARGAQAATEARHASQGAAQESQGTFLCCLKTTPVFNLCGG